MKTPIVVAATLLALLPARGPAAAQDCAADFDVLVARTQRNYAAYPIEVRGRRDAEYAALLTRARGAASRALSDRACLSALQAYTRWFRDPHLFVTHSPRHTPGELASLREAAERIPPSVEEAVQELPARGNADPIEGNWYDRGLEIAVRRPEGGREETFLAVVVGSDLDAWSPGDVIARITPRGRAGYRIDLVAEDRSPRYLQGRLYKGRSLLRMPPYAWGRRLPLSSHQGDLLHADDPRAPILARRGEGVFVLSVPSHAPRYRAALDSIVQEAGARLERAEILVIDLRGNEGGSSATTAALMPYLGTLEPLLANAPPRAPGRADGPDDAARAGAPPAVPVVYSSPANIAQFRRWTEWYDPDPEWLTEFLAELERRPGELVELITEDDPTPGPGAVPAPGPDVVALLVDRGSVSAAEAFVLRARRHERVTVFGENTGGSIDYQNVQILPLARPDTGFLLGYPTIASSARLPDGGFNRTGIAPDVRISATGADPIAAVLRYYAEDPAGPAKD